MLIMQAFGDPFTGCLGEMLMNCLRIHAEVGLVVDGCIRDWPKIRQMGVPVWATGLTPQFATQGGLLPGGTGFPWPAAEPSCSQGT